MVKNGDTLILISRKKKKGGDTEMCLVAVKRSLKVIAVQYVFLLQ